MAQIVINAKERQQAFWKFLLLFILAMAFVLVAFFFDTLVPTKDNRMMRQQLNTFKLQEAAQDRFVQTMEEAKGLIDSLRKPGAQKAYLNQQITEKFRILNNLQYKDSSMYSRLNTSVIDVFQRYQDATNKAIDMGDMPTDLERLKQENAQLNRDLIETRTALTNCLNTPR
ncbi:type VI secretion system TssO [Niabella soli]|uniref:Type VI secretion system transmembrane protein TssO n=1 Tax=Niabella soli DSM 19437 TaxID=929713 RepID=W0EY11_9BACT|nr:type VI secretion system TssO [Niabella soli]AHF15647.1 hypothetical protein NIASO_11755 [Niabella soli DSM 19437]